MSAPASKTPKTKQIPASPAIMPKTNSPISRHNAQSKCPHLWPQRREKTPPSPDITRKTNSTGHYAITPNVCERPGVSRGASGSVWECLGKCPGERPGTSGGVWVCQDRSKIHSKSGPRGPVASGWLVGRRLETVQGSSGTVRDSSWTVRDSSRVPRGSRIDFRAPFRASRSFQKPSKNQSFF